MLNRQLLQQKRTISETAWEKRHFFGSIEEPLGTSFGKVAFIILDKPLTLPVQMLLQNAWS